MADVHPQLTTAVSFHRARNYALWNIGAVHPGRNLTPAAPRTDIRYEVVQAVYRVRQLSLKVSPHYHPWIRELTRQLLRQSVRGLMDADTDFTTPVEATADGAAELSNRAPRTISKGDRLTIADGSVIDTALGGVRLAGAHAVKVPADASAIETRVQLERGAAVTIDQGVQITLADGTAARLSKPLTATLVDNGPTPTLYSRFFDRYKPNTDLVASAHPVEDIDFSTDGGYSVYNWELFFHIPLTLAIHLSRNGHYQQAMSWFHFVFNPTDDSAQLAPERYWKVRPFQSTEVEQIESILTALSSDPGGQEQTVNAINAWRADPFRPHLVARYRPSAYMYKTVMAYLDNLIAWGDFLFRQDTGETIDEALQLYVLAANVLGPRPQPVPSKGTVATQSYRQLRADLDPFGNALRMVEGALLLDLLPRAQDAVASEQMVILQGIGKSLYFGIPRNDKLLSYWDTVADRLFKIRNSLNIEGIFRRTPLFEPPIDPAMLARAAAAGISATDAMNAAGQLSPVRFAPLLRQAVELAQNVISLGQNLLSAIEKEDGETLALLRSKHERITANLATQVKYAQLQEATKSKEATAASINTALIRHAYYERLLGRDLASITIPELDAIDLKTLASQSLKTVEPDLAPRDVPIDIATDILSDAAGHFLNRHEAEELDKLSTARTIQDVIKVAHLAGQGIAVLPDFGVKFHFWGLGGDFKIGGTHLSNAARFVADVALAYSDRLSYEAGTAAKIGSYARREQEWAQQSNLALAEITQLHKQLRAAQLREAITLTELANHRTQLQQLDEVEQFLNAEGKSGTNRKVSTKALYTWNKREVRALYTKSYKLAFDVATRAQETLKHELGDPSIDILQRAGHMAGKEGLLAGEKLVFDLKRLDDHYLRNNKREPEVVRHVSLAQLNPLALLTLRTTGACDFEVPEEWYDLEAPSQYFRRIRSVAVTIPCVTGPYISVNCKLTLLKSTLRTQDGSQNPTTGVVNTIVASSAQQDSGTMPDASRDERWLPFELYGAAGHWALQLPGEGKDSIRTFDYDTISDVILSIRFTAKDGGLSMRTASVKNLKSMMKSGEFPTARLFSLRHEFPSQWSDFTRTASDSGPFTMRFEKQMFPYWTGTIGQEPKLAGVTFYAAPDAAEDKPPVAVAVADAGKLPQFGTEWEFPKLPRGAKDIWMLAKWTIDA